MKSLTDSFVLNNGVKIPCVGFGTWQTPSGEVAVNSVAEALKDGYRHIDTAYYYGNEGSVGEAVRASGIKREDIFITSKLWNSDRGYDNTYKAFNKTIENLGVDYLDLYLIHWPANERQFENWDEINLETWKAMTELYKAGKIRAIGVSNFMPQHLESLIKTEVKPMVNQIEYHPGTLWPETVKICNENDILVEAYSPLGTGKVLGNETLKEVAAKYNKSVAQLCIKFILQTGVLPLPKSVTPSRIQENTQVFDFEISDEDMNTIKSLDGVGFSGQFPDTVPF